MTLDVYRFAIPSHAPSSARRQKAQPASEGTRVRRHQRAVDEPAAVPLCVRSPNGSRSDCLKASFAHRTNPPRQYEVTALFTGGLSNREGGPGIRRRIRKPHRAHPMWKLGVRNAAEFRIALGGKP